MADITLSDFTSRPHTTKLHFGDVMLPGVIENYKAYGFTAGTKQPESLAIEFYLLNGATAMLAQQVDSNAPLTGGQQSLLTNYYASMQNIGHRAFFYLLLICTRETRHCKETEALVEACKPLGAYPFWTSLYSDMEPSQAVKHFVANPPNISLENYTEHLVKCFETGKHKSGFAGEPWAAVARPLRDFVHGTITMEVLLDTVWTLAHNNGPIFNKGMLFNNYTGDLQKILDVQKAGQMPNLVEFKESVYVEGYHLTLLNLCQSVLPDFGGEPVNWQRVLDLGGSNWHPNKLSKSASKPVTQKFSIDLESKTAGYKIQITPTEFVKKTTRKAKT